MVERQRLRDGGRRGCEEQGQGGGGSNGLASGCQMQVSHYFFVSSRC